jgi:hypothetical protein
MLPSIERRFGQKLGEALAKAGQAGRSAPVALFGEDGAAIAVLAVKSKPPSAVASQELRET